jgi:hypothetical protein
MRGKKGSKEMPDENTEEPVLHRLERMLEDSKALCHEDDPILRGQMQMVLGILADILEAKDPYRSYQHVVDYE